MPKDASLLPSTPSFSRHLPVLDGVRGLAILLVLMEHLLASNDVRGSIFLNTAITVRSAGWMGVDLFFVLSGFLITGILYDSVGGESYFRTFYARRFLRIFPLYYGVLFLLFALTPLLGLQWRRFQFVHLLYLQNLPPWSSTIPASIYGYVCHFWSLAVEEQFYLVWPLIIFLIRDRRRLVVVALTLASLSPIIRTWGVLYGASWPFLYECTLCRMDSLLLGAALALVMRGPLFSRILRVAPAACILFLGATLATNLWLHPWNMDAQRSAFIDSIGFSLLAVGFASLIAWSLQPASWLAPFFRWSAMRWMGKYSYGIYVLHLIVYDMIGLGPRHWLDAHFHHKAIGVALGGIPALVISLALAWLSYNFYESRFLRLKRHFEYNRRDTVPARREIAA